MKQATVDPVAVLTDNAHNQLLLHGYFVIVAKLNKHLRCGKVLHNLLLLTGL